MGLALALGRRQLGRTWPNPAVGAVVVETGTGRILGTGATAAGGRPHGETIAIAAAGEGARGATLYVSLEPCSHHGRTPPCADAIVRAGIARVVSALEDPDGRVAGRGHALIRAAGIAVEVGIGAAEAERAHRGHVTRVRHGRPAVTLKLARTPDGFAAAPPGEPRLLITGEEAGGAIHLMRAHADAILVGIGTVLADDPRLDVRLPGLAGRSPLPVVLDSHLRLPPGSRLAAAARERPLWVVCAEPADRAAELRLAGLGVDILRVASGPDGRIDLPTAMRELGRRGLTRIFCEGGPALADALAAAGHVDEVVLATGSRPLGRPGPAAVGPTLAASLARDFACTTTRRLGADRLDLFERKPCSQGS